MTTIRPYRASDVALMLAIEQQVQFSPWAESMFVEPLSLPRYFGFVAEQTNEVVGYYLVETILDEATLHNIAVNPEHQGHGLGFELLSHCIEQCRNSQIRRLFLEVRDTNLNAQALYHKVGFVRDGIRKDYYAAPWGRENGVLMSLPL